MDFVSLAPSPEEIAAGKLTAENLETARRAVNDDGMVVLEGIVDVAHLDLLKTRMLEDLKSILARPDAPFNFNRGNVQQDPPPFAPYLFEDVLLNPLVGQVSESVLGKGFYNAFYSGNTALPNGERQPVHPDMGQLWPRMHHASPAFALVVNVPVVDVSPQNGSTELWPETHLDVRYDISEGAGRIEPAHLDEWRAERPPFQPTMKRGSVLIRDMRMWHAGMPNHTDEPRPMIAMIHWAPWWNTGGKIPFPKSAEAFFADAPFRTATSFVDGEVDYLKHGEAYDVR
jgi:hypothetical protein